jgi:hypothetical protein
VKAFVNAVRVSQFTGYFFVSAAIFPNDKAAVLSEYCRLTLFKNDANVIIKHYYKMKSQAINV